MTDAVKMAIEALRPFAEAAGHIHPAHPDEATSLDGFPMSDFRRAAETLAALEQAGEPVACVACDDTPSAENNPCAVCGKRLGQEFDAGEPDAWRHRLRSRDENGTGIGEWSEWREGKAANYTNRYIEAEDCPLYAHPPQSRVAAEPVGLREAKASFKTALADLGKRDAVHWWGTDDSQHAERMKACKARCKRWGDCDEEDGSCAECDSDMAEALETRGSMKRRLRNYEARVDRFFQSDGLRAAQAALATPSQRDPQSRGQAFDGEGEGVRDALERILSCVDANGDGCYDTVEMVAGTKQNGQIVFKGSFITECVRARAALSEAREAGALADDSAPS